MVTAIFIVGTGRSGTHFATRTLRGFSNIWDPHDGKEYPEILYPIAKAAIRHKSFPHIARGYYLAKSREGAGRVLLDQHHPNLFFIPDLLGIYPDAVFLYPRRPIEQIVASMMRHQGILNWYDYAKAWRPFRRVPMPNQFLGIDRRAQIDGLPLALLCAYRVIAHLRKLEAMMARFSQVRVLSYENLVRDQQAEIRRVFRDSELDLMGDLRLQEQPRRNSLSKYQDVLSAEEIELVRQMEAEFDRHAPHCRPAPAPAAATELTTA